MTRKFQIEIYTPEEIEAIDIETALKILYPKMVVIEVLDNSEERAKEFLECLGNGKGKEEE